MIAEIFFPTSKLIVGSVGFGHVFISGNELRPMNQFSFETGILKVNQEITLPNGVILEPQFTLQCKYESDSELLALSSLFSGLMSLGSDESSQLELCGAVEALETYFASKDQANLTKAIEVGLAGELCVILNSTEVNSMVKAWHSSTNGTFDFSIENQRLEVKTSLSPQRIHNLRLSQSQSDRAELTYASVHCAESGDGYTLKNLMSEIEKKLDRSSISEFRRKCQAYQLDSFVSKFDHISAMNGIRFVPENNVPAPIISDASILEVTWKVNFSNLPSIGDLNSWPLNI